MKCCNNVAYNQRNMEYLEQQLQRTVIDLTIEAINKKVQGEQKPFRQIPGWDEFRKEHEEYANRYDFFVLEGESKTGKSSWIYWALGDPSRVYYTNCANCDEPDLRKFSWLNHKIILLDEAHPKMIVGQRLLFQCPPTYVKLGQSDTNCYSYDAFVSGTMLCICSNNWENEVNSLENEADRKWIRDNQVYYNTGKEPLFLK